MNSNSANALPVGLIVSCQPVVGGALDSPEDVARMARAVVAGGAVAVRLEGLANIRAARAAIDVPIIGLIKRDLTDSPVRITPYSSDAAELALAGCDLIAYDATDRARPDATQAIVETIHAAGKLAFADCATQTDGISAVNEGADIVGTTLSGYAYDVPPPETDVPDLDLISQLVAIAPFVVAEGRYWQPETVVKAIERGATAVVVGTAITRPEMITERFCSAITRAAGSGRAAT